MTKELELKLIVKYPTLFRNMYGSEMKTCMHWGCEHGNGWYNLLDETCAKIVEIDKKKIIFFEQIKEKFGTLTIYSRREGTKIPIVLDFIGIGKLIKKSRHKLLGKVWDITGEAGNKSAKICEMCGNPGKIGGGSWIFTLCDECRNRPSNGYVGQRQSQWT